MLTVCCDFHDDPLEIWRHLERMRRAYAVREDFRPIEPPPGWRLVPFGEPVPQVHREFLDGVGWLFPRRGHSTVTPLFARPAGAIRAYATPL